MSWSVLAGYTASPDAAWVTQQARQFSWRLQERELGAVRSLLHDRDGTFAAAFDTVSASGGIAGIKTPAQAPNANAVAERGIRSVRQGCLDQLLFLSRRHLTAVLKQYVAYYHQRRPHQGLGHQPPAPATSLPTAPAAPGRGRCRPVLGGIIHDYHPAA